MSPSFKTNKHRKDYVTNISNNKTTKPNLLDQFNILLFSPLNLKQNQNIKPKHKIETVLQTKTKQNKNVK